jgi:hypothetical protein
MLDSNPDSSKAQFLEVIGDAGVNMQPTMCLRQVVGPFMQPFMQGVERVQPVMRVQQLWQDVDTGEQEWRDIETVEETPHRRYPNPSPA